jgi:hypothetical protein
MDRFFEVLTALLRAVERSVVRMLREGQNEAQEIQNSIVHLLAFGLVGGLLGVIIGIFFGAWVKILGVIFIYLGLLVSTSAVVYIMYINHAWIWIIGLIWGKTRDAAKYYLSTIVLGIVIWEGIIALYVLLIQDWSILSLVYVSLFFAVMSLGVAVWKVGITIAQTVISTIVNWGFLLATANLIVLPFLGISFGAGFTEFKNILAQLQSGSFFVTLRFVDINWALLLGNAVTLTGLWLCFRAFSTYIKKKSMAAKKEETIGDDHGKRLTWVIASVLGVMLLGWLVHLLWPETAKAVWNNRAVFATLVVLAALLALTKSNWIKAISFVLMITLVMLTSPEARGIFPEDVEKKLPKPGTVNMASFTPQQASSTTLTSGTATARLDTVAGKFILTVTVDSKSKAVSTGFTVPSGIKKFRFLYFPTSPGGKSLVRLVIGTTGFYPKLVNEEMDAKHGPLQAQGRASGGEFRVELLD